MSSQEKSLTLGGNEQQHADADAAASCRRKVSLPAQKEELQLALLKTPFGENLFLDRVAKMETSKKTMHEGYGNYSG
ncbi:uncharacterized protein LOC130947817 isoform X2 [Arachis stenosperma]|uniref:uncharacterized protein LOC130947817 isoform X2 n=1 Tax=Arachis stenosperma TaxID=217475 RepID=UPI0025ABB5BC|nr:uncharacterized protein LOC130947817 isoform X2 [Arachis stenosperma]